MNTLIEMFREDVNNEDGLFTRLATQFTSILFKGIILLAVPIFTYFCIKLF
ncbi:hypothetical protein [Neobacillus sp. D3-1R]|uniref:hypothetical protein n=1 Tax=Neobacillus sp. D3-1R TaxID=3445778 RepID=UPI003F9FD336